MTMLHFDLKDIAETSSVRDALVWEAGMRRQRAETLALLRDVLACLRHPFDAAHNAALQARLVAAIGDAEGQA